ncbi:hypothetical protein FRC08_014502 [Ceratobasidium sp. 394]|nr:hypothetical protein FRC08_014502 [Ceratobasidium sp. 394]KAG9089512.1 hypothetical protein FS749_001274 [Ceratobasidium sp. UAMH 11750]
MPEPLTLNSAVLGSDEEDDDYVLDEQDSDSDGEVKRETKKQRVEEPTPAPVNPVANETTRNALWESFLESTATSASGSGQVTPALEPKTITIERRHRFAGEDVIEKVQVPEDSAEAVNWRKRQPSAVTSEQTSIATGSSPPAAPVSNATSATTQSPRPASTEPTKEASAPASVKPKTAGKPRKSLSSLAAATKPKKLTTLEKSRLDWQSHLATVSPDERDELERNKQAGGTGYLEKVDFLTRVGERRETVFEDSKRKRR